MTLVRKDFHKSPPNSVSFLVLTRKVKKQNISEFKLKELTVLIRILLNRWVKQRRRNYVETFQFQQPSWGLQIKLCYSQF